MAAKLPHIFVILAYKESPFLETCIKSVVNQTTKSDIVIATTTPNQHITSLAKKYHLPIITGTHTNIGGDFDFAFQTGSDHALVTIAHQDDVYEKSYTSQIIQTYQKHKNSSIIFTDYFELRGQEKVYTNANLKIKRLLLFPIHIKKTLKSKFAKRWILRFGCPICCPSVTFVIQNCPEKIFTSDFKSNVDWHAWEKLSLLPHSFTYIPKPLMGHRISKSSTTSDIIAAGIRTKEDYQIFRRFWPAPLAKLLTKFYQNSEKSNSLKEPQ